MIGFACNTTLIKVHFLPWNEGTLGYFVYVANCISQLMTFVPFLACPTFWMECCTNLNKS